MSDYAYDISHLLEAEPVESGAPALRAVKAPSAAKPAGIAAIQEALARELLKEDHAHDAMIQQYLRMADDATLNKPC